MTEATEVLAIFRVGANAFAVPAQEVAEFVMAGTLTPLPRAPSHIRGVVSYRGRALAVVSLHRLLDLPRGATGDEAEGLRLVLVRGAGMTAALEVDRFEGVTELPADALRPLGAAASPRLAELARAEVHRPDGIAIVLDVAALLAAAKPRE